MAVGKMKKEDVRFERLDERVARVKGYGRPFYLVAATEVYSKEGQGVIIVGNKQDYEDGTMSLAEIINETKDGGSSAEAFWFFDHPMSKGAASPVKFRYPTPEEIVEMQGWWKEYGAVVETSNLQNTWWMFASNVLAQREVEKYNASTPGRKVAQIANSDSHFRIRDIGLARTGMPKGLLNGSSADTVLHSLHTAPYSFHHPCISTISSGVGYLNLTGEAAPLLIG